MSELEPQEVPGVSLQTTEGEVVLHWFNCRMRTFLDPQYDHVEWRTDDDVLKGLRVGRAVLDFLFENQYPMQFDPVVDEATFEWFIQSEVRMMEIDLEE